MAEEVAEATDSLNKDTGMVDLKSPIDSLDLTQMLASEFEEQESERTPSSDGETVEEAEPVGEIEPTEEPAEEATDTGVLSQEESETQSEPEAEPD